MMPFTDKLKESTSAPHAQLEKMLVGRLRQLASAAQYAGLLSLFYNYFGGLEDAIDQHLDLTELPDYSERRKTASLVHDITSLGGAIPQKAGAGQLPPITSNLQALGALYVMEGSTLGGKYIAKMIAGQLALNDNNSLNFFTGYGDETETMWAGFKQSMNRQVNDEKSAAIVIASANATFEGFKVWIEQNG